jgi:hypothetical protein
MHDQKQFKRIGGVGQWRRRARKGVPMFDHVPISGQVFMLGGEPYELVYVDGPICRAGRRYATQFNHDKRLLRISSTVPVEHRPWAVAVAVSEACQRMSAAMADAGSVRPPALRKTRGAFSPFRVGGRTRGGLWKCFDLSRNPLGYLVARGPGCILPVAFVGSCNPLSLMMARSIARDARRIDTQFEGVGVVIDLRQLSPDEPSHPRWLQLMGMALKPANDDGNAIGDRTFEASAYRVCTGQDARPCIALFSFTIGEFPWRGTEARARMEAIAAQQKSGEPSTPTTQPIAAGESREANEQAAA